MTLSISFSSRILLSFFFAALIFTYGCTHAVTVQPNSPATGAIRIAVLPVENLGRKTAPSTEIRLSLINRLKMFGHDVLSDEAMGRFMTRHRIRYVGGIDDVTAGAFKDEEGVDAVLVISLELYDEEYPPKIGLICRLVSTGSQPVILWSGIVGLSGDDSPGLLELGLIKDPAKLRERAVTQLTSSLEDFLSGKTERTAREKVKKAEREVSEPPQSLPGNMLHGELAPEMRVETGRFRPKVYFRAPEMEAEKKYTVAVVPFFSVSDRRNAGEIMLLHFVDELARDGRFIVTEPGVVRQKLLNVRVIMVEGISLVDADTVSNVLKTDLVFAGKVSEYNDYPGPESKPRIDFSVVVIEKLTKKVVWTSMSYNQGDNGVLFFDLGRKKTAGALASEMAREVVLRLAGQ